MPTIIAETEIHAPRELCFDLARDIEIHCLTTAPTKERIVAGNSSGRLELGDVVTFEATHLGIRQRLTSRIVECDRPHKFVDEMVSGAFKSLKHLHEFEDCEQGTLMRDTLRWESPLGILGRVADGLIVKRHMQWFMKLRNSALKRIVEQHAADERQ